MALPDLIEIVPLAAPVQAHVTVPGSKSITNRALILAALADGETTLTGALWSEDTQIMVAALQAEAARQVGDLVGERFDLCVGDRLAGDLVDEGGLRRGPHGPDARVLLVLAEFAHLVAPPSKPVGRQVFRLA